MLRRYISISPSDAKAESVRIALLVVMFEKHARSSLLKDKHNLPSSVSVPYSSVSISNVSASRPRICFCVRFTMRSSDPPRIFARCLRINIATLVLFDANVSTYLGSVVKY